MSETSRDGMRMAACDLPRAARPPADSVLVLSVLDAGGDEIPGPVGVSRPRYASFPVYAQMVAMLPVRVPFSTTRR